MINVQYHYDYEPFEQDNPFCSGFYAFSIACFFSKLRNEIQTHQRRKRAFAKLGSCNCSGFIWVYLDCYRQWAQQVRWYKHYPLYAKLR